MIKHIIGLGKCGCNIAALFQQYNDYQVRLIDTEPRAGNAFLMQKQDALEMYEKALPAKRLHAFMADLSGSAALVIYSACGSISVSALRILKIIGRKCKLHVLMVRSSSDALSNRTRHLIERANCSIMQEYARSAAIERLWLVSTPQVAEVIGDISIKRYYPAINEAIASTFHAINVFSNMEPILGTSQENVDTARISTIGATNFETNEEKLFFLLDSARKKEYYYTINEDE